MIKKNPFKRIACKISDIIWLNTKSFFGRIGYQISKNTEKDKVIGLIKSLRPYETDLELIRMGSTVDGGYLVPDDLEGIKTCLSPGVDTESGFEIDCLNRGMRVYMADNSFDKQKIVA